MTKVAFVQRNLNENLAAMYLSACLKKEGHQVNCFIEAEEKDLVSAVKAWEPEIIGFTVISGVHGWCIEIAEKLKTDDNLIIFGGPHTTFFPEVIHKQPVDAICIGEGEGAIVDIVRYYKDPTAFAKIENLWVKQDGVVYKNEVRCFIEDLDTVPYPDREIFYKYPSLAKNSRKTIMCSRGCPYSCTFCFNSAYRKIYKGKGTYTRYRSAENVLTEIKELRDKWGLKSVFIQDDTFIVDKVWVKDFMLKYKKEIGLPFTALIRADLVDEDIVASLADAGCVVVHFGIESGNPKLRNLLLKKGVTNEQILATAMLLKKHKIRFKTYNILKLPGETIDQAFETVRLNSKIGVDFPWASIFLPYPKTELTNHMIENGLLKSSYTVDDLSASFFNPKDPSRDDWQFINLQRLFFYAVKLPFAEPVIRRLIKLPPNKFFDMLFYVSHAFNYRGSENMDLKDVVYFGLKALRTSI